jgi:hypothetical protein
VIKNKVIERLESSLNICVMNDLIFKIREKDYKSVKKILKYEKFSEEEIKEIISFFEVKLNKKKLLIEIENEDLKNLKDSGEETIGKYLFSDGINIFSGGLFELDGKMMILGGVSMIPLEKIKQVWRVLEKD